MREILFRGRKVDSNEWVYGCLVNNVFQYRATEKFVNYIFNPTECEYSDCFEDFGSEYGYYEVIPETIGQFTGLMDKYGNKIFEGDVTNYGTIIFKYGCFGIVGNNGFVAIDNWNLSHIEIIGNIHE